MDCRTGKTLNPHTCVYVKDCKPGYMRNNKFQCRKYSKTISNAKNKVKSKSIRNTTNKVKSNTTNKVISKVIRNATSNTKRRMSKSNTSNKLKNFNK